MTQQCINDKAVADTVEALIGAHLISLGLSSTLKFMDWLGIKVMLEKNKPESPLLQFIDSAEDTNASKRQLRRFYIAHCFELVEQKIGYVFGNKAFLVQAFTHASYDKGRVTGCYQVEIYFI
jgi:endoribonuclease Dicer